MSTLAEFMIIAGADNRPPMLDKPHPLIWLTVAQENGIVRLKTYEESSDKESFKMIVISWIPTLFFKVFHHMSMLSSIIKKLPKTYGTELSCLCKAHHCQSKNGKFMTNIKLERDLHTSNYDQLYAYLEQHEYTTPQYQQQLSPPIQYVYSPPPQSNPYGAPYHPQQYPTNLSHTQPSVPQNAHPPLTIPQQPQAEFPQLDSGLEVLTFLPGDDPIACMNKAMTFFSAVFTPRYPSTNNQLRSSSNLRNQATVQDGRVIVQQVQGRQGQNVVGSGSQGNALGSRGNISGQAKVAKCYNCQGEGHMARQCIQPKRRRDATWFKEKVLLVQAQAEDRELDEEKLAFLTDPGVVDSQEILQNTNTSAQQNSMILSMFEQMSNHATNWDKANNESKIVNESLTAELERYKERVTILKQIFNVDLSSCENFIDSQMDDMIRIKNTKFAAFERKIDTLK
nr:hypothetical protein [Tanacetum cinerariifolium]